MTEQILIVEDEFIVANDLKLILEKAGYKVCGIAASVAEARELIEQHKPGFVLLDIHLRGKVTGIQLAHELREQHIAFIYISANSNQQVLEAAKATEPYGFLVKPFRARDVLISLDIARYRHKHSLEAGLRQEALLHEKLQTIASSSVRPTEKLLQGLRTLQPYLPVDLLLVRKSGAGQPINDLSGYLRVGFDEYQWIGQEELLTITGLSVKEWNEIQHGVEPKPAPGWFNEEAFKEACQQDPVIKLMGETFEQHSLLQFTTSIGEAGQYLFTCYSRKPDAWHAGHLAILQRMKTEIQAIAGDAGVSVNISPAAKPGRPATTARSLTNNRSGCEGIVGSSHQLLHVLDQVSQVAPLDTSVLILGESGTGKEKIAQCIHQQSPRSANAFVKINCAALPATLIESELFGHEKGAFTGAIDRRIGKFEQANGGTIFLDEIGEMPLEMQVKLLRVLQEKEIERIGGQAPFKVNVRIVAATNRNLEQEVAEGRFRLDLYYRLNVFPVILPPLRERRDDIRDLAHHFALSASRRNNRKFQGITPTMMAQLEAWHWPGNIRELENVIEQAVILNEEGAALSLKRPLSTGIPTMARSASNATGIGQAQSLTDIKKIQEETEREYIISMLRKTNGRIRGEGGAAQLLNLKPTTLESRMLKLGIRKENL